MKKARRITLTETEHDGGRAVLDVEHQTAGGATLDYDACERMLLQALREVRRIKRGNRLLEHVPAGVREGVRHNLAGLLS